MIETGKIKLKPGAVIDLNAEQQGSDFKEGDKFVCTYTDDFNKEPSHVEGNEYVCLEFASGKGVDNKGIIKMTTEPSANFSVHADMKYFNERFKKIG